MSDAILIFILITGTLFLNKETLIQDLTKREEGEE
jgi:hypothetical protein